ncbi:MAG: hypothetical protein IKB50_00490 [Clostridia bacterium]|nr:hypothetical protein [Clostridia bacterium]
MSVIAVISSGDKVEISSVSVEGADIIYVKGLNTRRRLKRFISRNKVNRAVIRGEVPAFTVAELEKRGIELYTGKELMQVIYPLMISRAAKISGNCENCTVYDTDLDGITLDIIKCAAAHFRYVSLETEEDASYIATEILSSTGLALKLGASGGVGIIRSGDGGNHDITVDMRGCGNTVFADEKKRFFTADVVEAILGEKIEKGVLERHKIKIHSL